MKPKYQVAMERLALEWVKLWFSSPVRCEVKLRVVENG